MHILFHRGTPWQSEIYCSTKIYAKLFQNAGYQVSYLENPMDVFHLLKWKGYYHIWRKAPRWDKGIWIMNSFSVIPFRDQPFFNMKWASDVSYFSCVPGIASLIRRSGKGLPDVIWSAKPGSSVLKKIFPSAIFIFQVVDYYPGYRGGYIKAIEKRDYARADHIFLIGESLSNYLTQELSVASNKITVLGQGVSLGQFRRNLPEPDDIRSIPKPRAIWVGLMKKGDSDLFEAAAKSLQQKGGSLILIGDKEKWAMNLCKNYRNTYLLGPRPSESIPSYLIHSDIGLMLYDMRRGSIYLGQNPLKLYEFAAAGLPIISTPHDEFLYLKPPIVEVRSSNEVHSAIETALNTSKIMQQKSLSFAKNHSWHTCYLEAEKKIVDLIERSQK
jgi:glycosyltransferase involved in cell wall biosynthesis